MDEKKDKKLSDTSQVTAALKTSEERFRRLAENIREGVTIIEGQKVVYVNDRLCEILGYSRDEMAGISSLDFAAPEEKERLQQIMDQARQQKQPLREIEFWAIRKDGRRCYIRNHYSVIREGGEITGRYVFTADITEEKQAAEERERLQQDLIEAQQRVIKELSTPVIPVLETAKGGIIVMPLIGSIDSLRARDIMRALLEGISRHRAKVVILDVTGVSIVDSGVANHLNKTIQAARLKGARTIITGTSDAVAETIVDLGIDWGAIETMADLQTGLIAAFGSLGLNLVGGA